MKDIELLELAAKAAGYDISHPWNRIRQGLPIPINALCIPDVSTGWNPLTDDGDALRLAVTLGLDMNNYKKSEEVSACMFDGGIKHRCIERYEDDAYSATRRAIVRAAAEIGKTK